MGSSSSSGGEGKRLALRGFPAHVNNALRCLQLTPEAHYHGLVTVTLRAQSFLDPGLPGETDARPLAQQSISVAFLSVNDAPSVELNISTAAETVHNGNVYTIALKISDVDAMGNPYSCSEGSSFYVRLRANASNGQFELMNKGGAFAGTIDSRLYPADSPSAQWSRGSSADTSTLFEFRSSSALYNNITQLVRYTPGAASLAGAVLLEADVADGGSCAARSPSPLSAYSRLVLTVHPVFSPEISFPQPHITCDEDTACALPPLRLGGFFPPNVRIRLAYSARNGSLKSSLALDNTSDTASWFPNASSFVVESISLLALSQHLSSIVYVPGPNFAGSWHPRGHGFGSVGSIDSRLETVSVLCTAGSGSDEQYDRGAVTALRVSVSAVNDAPKVMGPSTITVSSRVTYRLLESVRISDVDIAELYYAEPLSAEPSNAYAYAYANAALAMVNVTAISSRGQLVLPLSR
jgi:hypothetical protein